MSAATSTQTNAWLRSQRKSDLVELADNVGLKNFESLKKSDLEAALDEFIAEHSSRFANRSDLAPYFNSRSKALGSPVKKEKEATKDDSDKSLKVTKRKSTADVTSGSSTALVQTPGRSLSQVAARIPLPATPADISQFADRSAVAVRKRAASMYKDSGINEASQATRETLSTVASVVTLISLIELYFIRPEVLPSRYAFTVPAVGLIGTSDYPVYLPDMFLVLTSSFWAPALTWAFTSLLVPSLFGYFFNLSATSPSGPRTRSKTHVPEYTVDPLTFSIVKALLSFVVYSQGVTFGGYLPELAIDRLNSAVYGGWKGMLVGCAVSGIVSLYDAVLRK